MAKQKGKGVLNNEHFTMIINITLKATKILNFSQLSFESHVLEFALSHYFLEKNAVKSYE